VLGTPWELVLVVSGFAVAHAALAFESAWQRPDRSRHVARVWKVLGRGQCSGSSSMRVRLSARSQCRREWVATGQFSH